MTRQLVSFTVGDRTCAIPIERVQEVLTHRATIPVPLSPPEVDGLANLRGQVVLSLDLGVLLGLSDRAHEQAMMIVIHRPDDPVALVVDAVGDVLTVDRTGIEDAPQTLDAALRPFVTGALTLDDRLVLVLDVEALIAS